MKRLVRTVLLALSALVLVAAAAPAMSSASARSLDCGYFNGGPRHNKAWLRCEGIPYTVIHAYGGGLQPAAVDEPAAGGPSCEWLAQNSVKVCYHTGGIPTLLCMKYFAGLYYSHHCGPAEAFSKDTTEGLIHYLKSHFTWHLAKACALGAISGVGRTWWISLAFGPPGWVFYAMQATGGCVATAGTFLIFGSP